VAWIGIRAYLAKTELERAVPLAGQARDQILDGNPSRAVELAEQLDDRTSSAVNLTGDPVWRTFEIIPWVGENLTAVRELSENVDALSTEVLGPLTAVAGTLQLTDLKPVAGSIDVQPLVDAQPELAQADAGVKLGLSKVTAIETAGTIEPVSDAVSKLEDALRDVAASVDALNNAAILLPSMLGQDGPRTYLVMFQNNAELRSTGGIPGAMALVSASEGRLELKQQASSRDFEKFDPPVVDLPVETRALYGDNTARYIQDVNFTPQFGLSAEIAAEMWKRQFGDQVDGVVSLDPVALSYLLDATGPIELPTGDKLSSDNAVQLLLQDVYAQYVDPAEQDDYFAAAAAAVFNKIAGGDFNPQKLIKALAGASGERRILLWSSHDEEASRLSQTTLSGPLPKTDSKTQAFGLYFNDATAAKMDPYLKIDASSGQNVCRADKLPTYAITVTLTNTAPLDASGTLPDYVTGGGASGVPAGNIRTNISLYGAPGSFNLGVLRDSAPVDFHPTSDSGYTLSKVQVELAPGQSTVLQFQFMGGDIGPKDMLLEHTPLVYSLETSTVEFSCENALQ
jgi:hypothetical protein